MPVAAAVLLRVVLAHQVWAHDVVGAPLGHAEPVSNPVELVAPKNDT
jgi:hypothetical protein